MGGNYILDSNGQPVLEPDLHKWAAWYETADNRRVAETITGISRISTVFLALDHAFDGSAPVLWESMVFGGPMDGEQDRYRSREEALNGHAAMVAEVRKAEQKAQQT